MTLPELNAIPEHLLTHEQWMERERLRWKLWQKHLRDHSQSQEVRERQERIGRAPGESVYPRTFEDRMRSREDQQRKVEREER